MSDQNFEPAFNLISEGSDFLLHQFPAQVNIDGITWIGDGEVRLELSRRSGICFYGKFQPTTLIDRFRIAFVENMISGFSINNRVIEGFAIETIPNDQDTIIKWQARSQPIMGIGDLSSEIVRVVFHLFNFIEFFGTRRSQIQHDSQFQAIEHIDLEYDGWRVELKSLPETSENFKKLTTEGGYKLTYVGCIDKVDSSPFSGKDAEDILTALRYFLSFAKGGWRSCQ